MKLAFAGILVFACLALTSVSSQYVELTRAQINANSEFLENLREYGRGYVVQKGVYESTKAKLPGLDYNLTAVEKIERRSTNAAAYYRFTLLLTEQQNQARVRATVTIRFDHRNGAFIVSFYRYTILRTSGANGGWNQYIPIDVRPFNAGTIDEIDAFEAQIQRVVANAIENNQVPDFENTLPDSTYTTQFVYYGYQKTETDLKYFWAKIVNTEGQYYRLRFSYVTPPATENGFSYAVKGATKWVRV